MIINLSNHPSSKWDEKQIHDALLFGDIVDMPFPNISVSIDGHQMDELVDDYYEKILKYKDPVVMIQGEFVFVFRLVTRLKAKGIRAISACTERIVSEEIQEDGSLKKTSNFRFCGFRDF